MQRRRERTGCASPSATEDAAARRPARLRGTATVSSIPLVAVDDREAPDASTLPSPGAGPEQQPHRRADAAGEHEPTAGGRGGDDRQLRAELRPDVRRGAEVRPQRVDGGRELLALA